VSYEETGRRVDGLTTTRDSSGWAFRIAPIADVDAEELVTGGKAGRLVAGFRGKPPLDKDALTDLLHRLSRLAVNLPEVAELDPNPSIARSEGCVAVDARVRVRGPERSSRLKTCNGPTAHTVAASPQFVSALGRMPHGPASRTIVPANRRRH
jgi:acyl-CoA synthetase (NDP forming)